jgi:RNA polymerase sigma-70 factor (ECF subfamily)
VPPSHPLTPPPAAAPDEPADPILVERSQRGDLAAFDALVTRHRSRVYGQILAMVRNEADAWDLAQDTFLKAWKALPKFEGQSAFSTWIYRIAHNTTLDWLRSRKIEGHSEFNEAVESHVAAGATTTPHGEGRPDDRMAQGELGRRIHHALGELTPEHRTVILLREVEGRSYEEIAEMADCSLGTVMSRLFYARKKLQSLLADVHDSPDWQ